MAKFSLPGHADLCSWKFVTPLDYTKKVEHRWTAIGFTRLNIRKNSVLHFLGPGKTSEYIKDQKPTQPNRLSAIKETRAILNRLDRTFLIFGNITFYHSI